MIGAVRAPKASACGDKPDQLSASAICDSDTKEWREAVEVKAPEPDFATCYEQPPADVMYPICDMDTGLWISEDQIPSVE